MASLSAQTRAPAAVPGPHRDLSTNENTQKMIPTSPSITKTLAAARLINHPILAQIFQYVIIIIITRVFTRLRCAYVVSFQETSSTNSRSNEQLDLNRSTSQESTAGPSKDKKDAAKSSDKPKKKPAWYSAFYPTYKSRSEDFKRLFKNVPDDERLIVGKYN